MALGFQLTNNDGIIKIDDVTSQLILFASGSITLTSSLQPQYYEYIRIYATGIFDKDTNYFIFIKPEVMGNRIETNIISYGDAAGLTAIIFASAPVTVEWRVYVNARLRAPATTGAGLEVYSSTGSLLYSSEARPMSIIAVPMVYISSFSMTIDYPPIPYGNAWYAFPEPFWMEAIYVPSKGLYAAYSWGFVAGTNSITFTIAKMFPDGYEFYDYQTMLGQTRRFFVGYDL